MDSTIEDFSKELIFSRETGKNLTLVNGTTRGWSPFDGDEEFSGLYRHNSAIFYAEPHLKSFYYYRLINQVWLLRRVATRVFGVR